MVVFYKIDKSFTRFEYNSTKDSGNENKAIILFWRNLCRQLGFGDRQLPLLSVYKARTTSQTVAIDTGSRCHRFPLTKTTYRRSLRLRNFSS